MAGIVKYRSDDFGKDIFARSNKKDSEMTIDFNFELETSNIEIHALNKMPFCELIAAFDNECDFWRMARWLGKHIRVYSRCDSISSIFIYDLPVYLADSMKECFGDIPFVGNAVFYFDGELHKKGNCNDFPIYDDMKNYFVNARLD